MSSLLDVDVEKEDEVEKKNVNIKSKTKKIPISENILEDMKRVGTKGYRNQARWIDCERK